MPSDSTNVVELPTRIVWKFHHKVVSVVELTKRVNYRKARPADPPSETNVEYDTVTIGWSVRMENGSAVGPFPEDPGYVPGDILEQTLTLHAEAPVPPKVVEEPTKKQASIPEGDAQ